MAFDEFFVAGGLNEGLPGLAHFLEHMLFFGSKKYPKKTDYTEYVEGHGGTFNAFTALDETVYFFTVSSEFLLPTLDR